MESLTTEHIWQALHEVKDPEIPVVSVVEMGIIRTVSVVQNRVLVTMTPTFSGCPALQTMQQEVQEKIRGLGVEVVTVRITLDPPWSTDWITDEAREKLKAFGLAPPPKHHDHLEILLSESASCPYCDSSNTTLKNSFGPTLCRAIYYCHTCQQPFEQFKPL
jgi:ring-1,2-phenylacetyl-CoA epoxidase subunit PaaD